MKKKATIQLFNNANGVMTTRELQASGLSFYQINKLLEKEVIQKVKRGIYVAAESESDEYNLLMKLLPKGVVCLYSAALIYDYSTHLPTQYHVVIPNKAKATLPDYPPIQLYYWSKSQRTLGVTQVIHNEVVINIYNKEKTVCDFIKFRNKIGKNIVKEVIKSYLKDRDRDLNKISEYAKQLRIATVLNNYFEILL